MSSALREIGSIPASLVEIGLVLTLAPALIALSRGLRWWPTWLRVVVVIGAIGIGLECIVEKPRWPLIPAVILSGELVFICALTVFRPIPLPRTFGVVGWTAFWAGIAVYLLVPAFALPKPNGSYPVGTVVMHLVDHGRREALGGDNNNWRELMVQVWYPAQRSKSRGPVGFQVWPRKARGVIDAPLSPAEPRYPVLIFSPSWHGQRGQNLFQVEELASRGFIVVGIDHPYSSAVTVFPGGRVARARLVPFWDFSSDQALQASIEYIERVLSVRVQDVEFLVAELERLSQRGSGSMLSERLDLSRLGILGYSFGGAVAAQVCWLDKRFKAGMDMDGTLYGAAADAGVSQPFMFLVESTKAPTVPDVSALSPEKRRFVALEERDFYEQRNSMERHGGYWLGITGTQHINFTDPPVAPTVGYYLLEAGTIAPVRALRTINAYTVAFFEKHLNHRREPLLEGPSPAYPEVDFAWPLANGNGN